MPSTPTVSVSSFSLREQLGPIVFTFRDATGADQSLTLDAPRLFDVSDFPRRARDELGVEAVETVGFHFAGLGDPQVDLFERALSDSGVRLMNMCLDMGDLADADDGRRAEDLTVLKQWADRFAAMGSQFIRVNPGSPMSPHHGDVPTAWLVDALGELGQHVRAAGSRLLVENHGGKSSDPDWLGALLDGVGRDAVGLLLDLGNFDAITGPLWNLTRANPDPSAEEVAALLADLDLTSAWAGIETLAPRSELVSVKSHLVTDDGDVGVVDLPRAFDILTAAGYTGDYSVEYEGIGGDPWVKTRRVVDVTRDHFAATAQVS